MTSDFYTQLDEESKQQYSKKLIYSGIKLPDPLNANFKAKFYKSRYLGTSPNLSFGDIYIYLVETEGIYSREEFKNYKTLDCYKMVLSDKVRDILAYKCVITNMCVLTCDIQSDTNQSYQVWVVIATDGVIQNGHCTCMNILGSTCSHMAALLFSLEMEIKKDILYENLEEHSWERAPKKIRSSSQTSANEIYKQNSFTAASGSQNSLPPSQSYREFLKIIKKFVPNAPIFSLLSDSDFSSDEEINDLENDSTSSNKLTNP